jgi:hypothetical protein
MQADTSDNPCERGATASDPESGNLTAAVVTCPPAACLPLGCPLHKFTLKGIKGCGVDTVTAAVGTEFWVQFVVWDGGAPPERASAWRVVRVVTPCEAGETYCPDAPAEHQCGTLDCAARSALLALVGPEEQQPRITFTPPLTAAASGSATGGADDPVAAAAPCGERPGVAVAPCMGAAPDFALCGVDVAGPGGVVPQAQLRERLVMDSRGSCAVEAIANGTCAVCPQSVLLSGLCTPSMYNITYVVRVRSLR